MQTPFLQKEHLDILKNAHTTPCYVYSEQALLEQTKKILAFPHAYGLTVRYAMKANANNNILKLFHQQGIHIDASSGFEVQRALAAGIPGSHIQLSGQELPQDIHLIGHHSIQFVATSLHQLRTYGEIYPHTSVGVRLNPGIGSGAFKKIDTGGPTSSFGIWHAYLDEIHTITKTYNLTIDKIHIHIGSENTPQAWSDAAQDAIRIVAQFPHVTTLNMGGGFKIAIMPYEQDANLQHIGKAVQAQLESFAATTGRKIHLEIEPGKYLIMNTCSMVARVIDIVDTGNEGYHFIKVNTGMTELPRTAMYGIQQPIHIQTSTDTNIQQDYVVVGHCCESGDLLTCMLYQSETVEPITLSQAHIGDSIIIQSCGAYNASMAMKHYNSYPEAEEVLLKKSGELKTIRKRQAIEAIRENEVSVI